MRKTQVALAALALMASTAALAGEVTMSGQIDIGVFHSSGFRAGGVRSPGGVFMEQGGYLDHSSVTLSASESMGSMKVGAVLEAGFNANGLTDNGGNQWTAGTLFNRNSYVYVADSWGQVGLGKQLSPYILSMALTNGGFGSFWVPRLAVNGNVGGSAFACGGISDGNPGVTPTNCFFQSNAITYTSPSIGGFTITGLLTAPSSTRFNNLNNGLEAQKNDRYSSANISGNIGDLFISAAMQRRSGDASDAGGGSIGYKSWMIGATLPLTSELSAYGSYDSHKNDVNNADTVNSYGIGLRYMLSAATAAQAGFAANDRTGNAQRTVTNIALIHSLSKRSSVYTTLGRGKNVGAAVGNFGDNYAGESNTVYGVGVAHTF